MSSELMVAELAARVRTLESVTLNSPSPRDLSPELQALKKELSAVRATAETAEAKAASVAGQPFVTAHRHAADLRTTTVGIAEGVAELVNKLEDELTQKLKASALDASASARAAEANSSQLAVSMRDYLVSRAYEIAHGEGETSVAAARNTCLNTLKAVASSVDPAYLVLKGPILAPRTASAGELMVWAATHSGNANDLPSISRMLKSTRASIKARLEAAMEPLDQAHRTASKGLEAAEFLEGGGSMPAGDPLTVAALSIVKRACQAGQLDSPAAELRRLATAALLGVQDAHAKADSIKAAANIAVVRQQQKALMRFAEQADEVTKGLLLDRAARMGRVGQARAASLRAQRLAADTIKH